MSNNVNTYMYNVHVHVLVFNWCINRQSSLKRLVAEGQAFGCWGASVWLLGSKCLVAGEQALGCWGASACHLLVS